MRPVTAIVQARMGSARLPGKSLAPVGGRPALAFMLERVRRARRLDRIVVATTDAARDDEVAATAAAEGATVFRGSEHDVLDRYVRAARAAGAATVVRLTADCPLLDPVVIDEVVDAFEAAQPGVDLATNAPPEGRTYPKGMDVEVFSRDTLERVHAAATDPLDREHVTRLLHRGGFRVRVLHLDRPLGDVRVTVDDATDLARVRRVVDALPDDALTLAGIVALAERDGGP